MRFWATIGRSLKLRCPRCGGGKLFRRFFEMEPSCPACGLSFHPESGYYVGAMYVNYFTTVALALPLALVLLGRVPAPVLVAPLVAFGVLFPVVFFRHSRSLWLGIETYVETATGGVSEPPRT